MMKKHTADMSNEELEDELYEQNEWLKDDSFEFVASNRGDNGFKRMDYISELYDELVKRGLREPLVD
jgi:hypothetical protein